MVTAFFSLSLSVAFLGSLSSPPPPPPPPPSLSLSPTSLTPPHPLLASLLPHLPPGKCPNKQGATISWDPKLVKEEQGRPEAIWRQIRALRGEGKVLSLSSSRYDNESRGMVKFHGYAFLSTYEDEKEGLRLVKVGSFSLFSLLSFLFSLFSFLFSLFSFLFSLFSFLFLFLSLSLSSRT